MTEYVLPRSPKALEIQIALISITTFALALLSFLLVRFFYHVALSTRWYTGLATSALVIVIGYISTLLYQKKWKVISYKLAEHAILVNQSNGLFSTSQEVYLYESIISANMTQGYLGKKYGYGDIKLVIPKLDSSIDLKDLSNPEKQLKQLGSHLEHKVDRKTLVT